MINMQGRTAIVFGVANKRSIAWAIAQKLHAAGAKLVITYQNERLEQEAKDLIADLPGAEGFRCDRHLRTRRHAQVPRRTRSAETQYRRQRSRRHRPLPRL